MASPVSEAEQEAQAEAKGYSAVETEAEQARLLYVALTRAANDALFTWEQAAEWRRSQPMPSLHRATHRLPFAKMTDEQWPTHCFACLNGSLWSDGTIRSGCGEPYRVPSTRRRLSTQCANNIGHQRHRGVVSVTVVSLEPLALNSHEAPLSLRDESPDVPLAVFPRGARVGDFSIIYLSITFGVLSIWTSCKNDFGPMVCRFDRTGFIGTSL